MTDQVRRVATYERVSSEDQRERETIKTQSDVLARRLEQEHGVALVARYQDDGISGRVPMRQRQGGGQALRDASAGLYDELWVYRYDRLGRDEIDPLIVRRELEHFGVVVCSATEGPTDDFMYAIHVQIAAKERRDFLRRSQDGTRRAAHEARYLGGIVAAGYKVEGKKPNARLVPDDTPALGDLTGAGLVRMIFHLAAYDRLTCVAIARRLNALGAPTVYRRDGRGIRQRQTQGTWGPGRVRAILINPAYQGTYTYGKRSAQGTVVLEAALPALVTPEVWQAAQETLRLHRLDPQRGTPRLHLLRSKVICGLCGRHFSAVHGRDQVAWYRCNGGLARVGILGERCHAKGLKSSWLEPLVWRDLEQFLRNPGPLLEELNPEQGQGEQAALLEADRRATEEALVDCAAQRKRAQQGYLQGLLSAEDLRTFLDELTQRQEQLEARRAELWPSKEPDDQPAPDRDLLDQLRARLDAGLDMAARQEIVRLLVKRIVVHTTLHPNGKKSARLQIEYRFPLPEAGVGPTPTGTPASQTYTHVQRVVQV